MYLHVVLHDSSPSAGLFGYDSSTLLPLLLLIPNTSEGRERLLYHAALRYDSGNTDVWNFRSICSSGCLVTGARYARHEWLCQ